MTSPTYTQALLPTSAVITDNIININIPSINKDGQIVSQVQMINRNGSGALADAFDELSLKIRLYLENPTADSWAELRDYFVLDNDIEEEFDEDFIASENIEVLNGKFYYKGLRLRSYLVDKIVSIKRNAKLMGVDPNKGIKSLTRFLERLLKNPSPRAVSELYGFVEHTRLPITADGHLLAYKIINSDYTDKYTGKMDNSIGALVEMPRVAVDDDAYRTCSAGLHFCSWEYARGFYCNPKTDRMVVLKIDPADVVSIPVDYNNSKGRACRYTVLYEVPMEEVMERDILSDVIVYEGNNSYEDDSNEEWQDLSDTKLFEDDVPFEGDVSFEDDVCSNCGDTFEHCGCDECPW